MDSNFERLMVEAYDQGVVSEVIRPAAIVPEGAARAILVELVLRNVQNGGLWQSEPSRWSRYDRPWHGPHNPAGAELIGDIQVAYGTPTKYEITLYRLFGVEGGSGRRADAVNQRLNGVEVLQDQWRPSY